MTDIYTALTAINTDMKAIGKNHHADLGTGGKYKFRGIDDMYNELHELFVKHEVVILPRVENVSLEVQEKVKEWNGNVTKSLQYSTVVEMTFVFMTTDGSSVEARGVGHALDSSDKGTNKAQSSALKYCLMQMFLIPTEDDKDVENANNEVAPAKKLQKDEKLESLSHEQAMKIVEMLSAEATKKTGYAYYKKIGSKTKIDVADYEMIQEAIKTAYGK